MRTLLLCGAAILACNSPDPAALSQWNVRFALNDSTEAHVRFEGNRDGLFVRNDAERIPLEAIGEGVYRMPVFGGSLRVVWNDHGFEGHWIDSLRPDEYRVPFTAESLDAVPETGERACGEWNFLWEGDTLATDRLLLCTWGDSASGTVASPTGDLRYLAGTLRNGILNLSTFDGAHLYAFQARATANGFVNGTLHSGIHGFTRWRAEAGEAGEAPHAETLRIAAETSFAVRTSTGRDSLISAVPPAGKLHLISIAGTWCPNCMDEARTCAELLQGRNDVQWSVVLFERDSLPKPGRLAHWARSCGASTLPFIGGGASKERAAEVFPWIPGGISAFPTTAIVRDDGSAWVHVGFDGPATGTAHTRLKEVFREALQPTAAQASDLP